LTLGLSGCTALKIAEKELKVAYTVFVSDIKDATMKDALAVQAEGFRQAAALSRHNVDILALVLERCPKADEEFLKEVGFTVIRKPHPVNMADMKGNVKQEWARMQGHGGNSAFLMADESLKYWPLSMTEYDRVLVLDSDVMVLDPMDELMERTEDFVGTYDPGLDTPSSLVPPVQGGFLLYRPNMADFKEVQRLTTEGEWYHSQGWGNSDIGYCYGGTGPTGLLSYLYHKDALPQLKAVGKKNIRDGPRGEVVPGVRMFAADRSVYDVVVDRSLRKDVEAHGTDIAELIKGVKSVHFTGACQKPWMCESPSNAVGNLCAAMTSRWFAMRSTLDKANGELNPCDHGHYKTMY